MVGLVGPRNRLRWSSTLLSALYSLAACGSDDAVPPSAGSEGTAADTASQDDDGPGQTGPGPGDDTRADGASTTDGGQTTAGDTEASGSEGDVTTDGGSDGTADTGVVDDCGCPHVYIWVANAGEHTVSKINTETLQEEGRYLTREDGDGDPSRTSVNLAGDVVVANRYGGVTKFWADEASCEDRNGDGTIQTSSGADDVLPWDDEECRAWSTPFDTTNQRPVAWTPGDRPDSCDASTAEVWTVASTEPGFPGLGGAGGVTAYLLDGQTGAIEQTLAIPDFNGFQFGAYGGAVDGEGNFWFSSFNLSGGSQLARIDRQTLAVEIYDAPEGQLSYGITVDHLGRPWVAGVLGAGAARFEPATETWVTTEAFTDATGIAEGPDGLWMFVATDAGVQALDLETLALGASWSSPQLVKGVGFDIDGYLWAVATHDASAPEPSTPAFKIDVDTMTTVDSYDGLTEPYTYSDLTGSALRNFSCLGRR